MFLCLILFTITSHVVLIKIFTYFVSTDNNDKLNELNIFLLCLQFLVFY
jgi:hypothetical protein